MKYELSLRPVASARDGVPYGSGTVMRYEVTGLPEGQKIAVQNSRAMLQEPVWEISKHKAGQETKWTGAFKTAQDALLHLQQEFDAAENITHEDLDRAANAAGWRRMPIAGDATVSHIVYTCGPAMVQVRTKDSAWAFYTEVTGGKNPDKWGKDLASLVAFFAEYRLASSAKA